jgi:hypothetical protein
MKTIRELRWMLPLVLLGGACSSLIGIEDIYEDPKGDEGEGGENGSGGSNGGSGGTRGGSSGASGSSGSSGQGGSSGASGSTSTGGDGGDPGTGGTSGATGGNGGDGATGGSGGMGDMTVRGRVITTWMQPVPNVTVMIGDAEAETNADGEFEIPDVAETYDAKFVLNYDVYGSIRTYGWVYLGLTRREPTLQVYNGAAYRSGNIAVTPMNLSSTNFTNQKLAFAIGGPDGNSNHDIPLPNGYAQTSSGWQGPLSTQVTAHALLFDHDANELPTVYKSYDQVLGVLSETQPATFVVNVPDETVGAGTISGRVTSVTSSDRTNYVFVRFESNAAMELVEQYGSTLDPLAYTYVVPAVQGGSIEVGALEGTHGFSSIGVAHRDRLAPGQMDVALDIPTPPQLVAPADQITGVDGDTVFSWTSQGRTFLWHAENRDVNTPTFGGMYIVTAAKRVSIPEFPNGFTLIPDDLYGWSVEVHNDVATVDDLAGPQGFIDSWAPTGEGPSSPRRGDGSFSATDERYFTTAP